jgi:PAS domain S-box-containing protein
MTKSLPDSAQLHIADRLTSGLSAGLFEDLVENFPDIIHSVNRDGLIVSTNRKAEHLLGYDRNELLGMSVLNIYADEVRHFVVAGFEELKSKGYNEAIESKLKSKTGEIIDVEIRSFSLYDSQNQFDRTFSIIRDIREKKRLQAQLFQQSKLAGIGELAAGIVHDIRNPLSVIMGLSRTALKRAAEEFQSERIMDLRNKIDKAAERINRLCNHLRDYTRQEHERAGPTSVKALVEDCLLMCDSRIKSSGTKVEIQGVDPGLVVVLPSNGLEQVLINIVSNACDAVTGQADPVVRIRFEQAHQMCVFVVEDSGPGVPEAARAQIFDSFFTTKPKGQGTGLGLSICRGIVEEHGGSLALDDSYTAGARFRIALPCLAPKTAPGA